MGRCRGCVVAVGWLCLFVAGSTSIRGQGAAPPITVRAEAPATVRFGEPFEVRVTLTNHQAQPLRWPGGAVRIEPAGWHTYGVGGTGPGDGVAVSAGKDRRGEVLIGAGQ